MKKALWGLAIIIIIGAGAYFLMKPGSAIAPKETVQNQAQNSAGNNGESLGALVAAGSPVTCTFSTTTASGSTHGTVYVANGMVAGDFTTQASAGTIDSHM